MTKNRWMLAVGAMLTLFSVTACGGGGETAEEEEPEDTSGNETVVVAEPEPEPEPVATPAPSPVRVIHAAAAAAEGMLAGNAGEAAFADIAFATSSAYSEVAPAAGENTAAYNLMAGDVAVEGAAELDPGTPATVVVYSTGDDMAGLGSTVVADEAHSVTGQIRGRLINALHGAAAVDLCLPGPSRRAPGQAVFMNVAYGEVGGIPSFPSRYQPMNLAGVERIQIRTADETACSGSIIGVVSLPPIDLNEAHNLTMVVVGRAGRARPRVARQMLVCEDAPAAGTCVALPLAAR